MEPYIDFKPVLDAHWGMVYDEDVRYISRLLHFFLVDPVNPEKLEVKMNVKTVELIAVERNPVPHVIYTCDQRSRSSQSDNRSYL